MLWSSIPFSLPLDSGLIQTAIAEYHIACHINKTPPAIKPSLGQQPSSLSDLIPLLLSSIEEENDFPQDIFQAQVCLGWVHWTLSEPALAALRLPKDLDVTMHDLSDDGQEISSWTEVSVIKAGYMKGSAPPIQRTYEHRSDMRQEPRNPWYPDSTRR